jgi:hypothetical protein
MDLKNLITDEDNRVLHDLKNLIPIVKNKWFSLGRDMDKLNKLVDSFGKIKEEPKTIIESVTCSAVIGNTLVRAKQTVITRQ